MRYAVVLIINIILVLAGFFLLIVDPLNKQLPVKMIAIWFIVFVILDYPLRHYKIYKEIRIFLYMIFYLFYIGCFLHRKTIVLFIFMFK